MLKHPPERLPGLDLDGPPQRALPQGQVVGTARSSKHSSPVFNPTRITGPKAVSLTGHPRICRGPAGAVQGLAEPGRHPRSGRRRHPADSPLTISNQATDWRSKRWVLG